MNAPLRQSRQTSPDIGLEAIDVRKSFGERTILDGVNLSLPRGQILAIVGESGCGKSTLLRLFAGLDSASEGAVFVAGKVSVAFQDSRLMPWLKVWENVAFGLPFSRREKREKALGVLAEVGLGHLRDAWPGTLSGGEGQRVALARALIRDPAALLLDEPFGALDALTRIRMHALLLGLWRKHGFTVVIVTHDVDEALTLADRVVVLGEGRVLDQFPVEASHPRNRLDPDFGRLRERIFTQLGVPTV
ncbi:aliphatic sulfonate ABC transporter ATP-binding protein [Kaistia sp. 32K]|uniref:ABC transporter ATP-binding protein n=1 Tax=Kaistia sp. 32K TaxID=2795690 RepID=UPI001915C089|nr:ABC transporter ATP-binding protein [Kaistia sp. 32K]BCP54917.1 aliphatic sulfonate ABC transporter ATP-binding protein [Kaistia sp. 32K]